MTIHLSGPISGSPFQSFRFFTSQFSKKNEFSLWCLGKYLHTPQIPSQNHCWTMLNPSFWDTFHICMTNVRTPFPMPNWGIPTASETEASNKVLRLEIWAVWCEQPPPYCSFARHLVWNMVIQTDHLLITIPAAQLGVAKTLGTKKPNEFDIQHSPWWVCNLYYHKQPLREWHHNVNRVSKSLICAPKKKIWLGKRTTKMTESVGLSKKHGWTNPYETYGQNGWSPKVNKHLWNQDPDSTKLSFESWKHGSAMSTPVNGFSTIIFAWQLLFRTWLNMHLYTGEGLMKEGKKTKGSVSENEVTPLSERTCQMISFLTSGFQWFPQLILVYTCILKNSDNSIHTENVNL